MFKLRDSLQVGLGEESREHGVRVWGGGRDPLVEVLVEVLGSGDLCRAPSRMWWWCSPLVLLRSASKV